MRVPKTYLNKFQVVEEPCTTVVQCMSTIDESFRTRNKKSYFVPLRVVDGNKLDDLTELLANDDDDTIDIEKLYPFMMSGTLWADNVNSKFDLPVKGENLYATFEENELDVLECAGLIPLGKAELKKFNVETALRKHV